MIWAKPHHGYREVEMAGFNTLIGTGRIAREPGTRQLKMLMRSIKEIYSGRDDTQGAYYGGNVSDGGSGITPRHSAPSDN
jgi:hypothetical protein